MTTSRSIFSFRTPLRPWAVCLALVLLAALAPRAQGHELNTSYTTVTLGPDSVHAVFMIDVVDLAIHFGLDADADGRIAGTELLAGEGTLFAFLQRHAALRVDGRPVALAPARTWFTEDDRGNAFMHFALRAPLQGRPDSVALHLGLFERFGPEHVNLVVFTDAATDASEQAVLRADAPRVVFALAAPRSRLAQAAAYVGLGVEHIFIGYDHILFLLALIVVGGGLLEGFKIVTAFTVAHSITLVLATLQVVTLPGAFVEAAIALSIAYVAAENFFVENLRYRWVLAFVFGLVHGFGFANVLRELGLPREGLVTALLAFNVGVEVGQLCIVALLFPLAVWIGRRSYGRRVVVGVSVVILLFGLGWFVERVFGLAFMPV